MGLDKTRSILTPKQYRFGLRSLLAYSQALPIEAD
jgi:hypothetical protein